MRNIAAELEAHLRSQDFDSDESQNILGMAIRMARTYQKLENAVVVLSDLEEDKSYIFYGKFSEKIGLFSQLEEEVVESIWEDKIFGKIHPEDLLQKHLMELQFFHFIHKQPLALRKDYYVNSVLRMKNESEWFSVRHRMFYIGNIDNESTKFALCLYQSEIDKKDIQTYFGEIVDTHEGTTISLGDVDKKDILTRREIEILRLIKQGKDSNAIAALLSISKFTVNRHRQNILAKLKVKNSYQACQIATSLMLL